MNQDNEPHHYLGIFAKVKENVSVDTKLSPEKIAISWATKEMSTIDEFVSNIKCECFDDDDEISYSRIAERASFRRNRSRLWKDLFTEREGY